MEYDNNIKAYQEEVFFLKVKMIFKQPHVLYIYFFLLFFNCVEKTFSYQMQIFFRLYTVDFTKLRFVGFKVGNLLTILKTVNSNYVKEYQYNNSTQMMQRNSQKLKRTQSCHLQCFQSLRI